MRILYVCNEYPPVHHGGIGSYTKLNAEFLIKECHQVFVIGYGNGENTYYENINGVQIKRLKRLNVPFVGKLFNLIWLLVDRLFFFFQVSKYVKRINPDIIETYDWSAPLIFKLKKHITIIRLHGSNTVNNVYMHKPPSVILSHLEKIAIKKANYVLSVSNHIAELTKKTFKLNFESKTIYNGVDTSLFNDFGKVRDINKILFVGRMHPYKGMEDLFSALNYLFKVNKNVYLEVICTVVEEYKNKLMSLVNSEFHSRVIFVGRINNNNLPDYYNSANVSILPSRAEAFPIIPLESMACGTPVIMADRFSAREIVEDNVNGFLVNTLDKREFSESIVKILRNQKRIECMRIEARRKIVTNFNIKETIVQNMSFYNSIISANNNV